MSERKPFLTDLRSTIGVDAIKLIHPVETSFDSRVRMMRIKQFLSSYNDYSLLLYSNHISLDDLVLPFVVHKVIDPHWERKILAPISFSHLDKKNQSPFEWLAKTGVVKAGQFLFSTEVVPVVQSYQVKNSKYGYTTEEANETYKDLLTKIKELANKRNQQKKEFGEIRTKPSVFVFPEAHRKEFEKGQIPKLDQLQDFDMGVFKLMRFLSPALIVPVGITYEGRYSRETNFFKGVFFEVGNPIQQLGRDDEPTKEKLVNSLVVTLRQLQNNMKKSAGERT